MELLLITGAAGVGKSTLSWELSAQLAGANVAHALIESDELDWVYPKPGVDELNGFQPGTIDVSSLNLGAIWSTYRKLGHSKLIMSGVMLHLRFDRQWILAAIPDAEITVVRLTATEPALLARLTQREVGAGAQDQVERSLRQARRIAGEDTEGLIVVSTDGRRPPEIAEEILAKISWFGAGPLPR